MVKELMHDPFFLSMPSQPAGEKDLPIARDLLDTLIAHRQSCVGMAANMIGQRKRIIAFGINDYTVMLNPEIIKKEQPYQTKESCLSLRRVPITKYWFILSAFTHLNNLKMRQYAEYSHILKLLI